MKVLKEHKPCHWELATLAFLLRKTKKEMIQTHGFTVSCSFIFKIGLEITFSVSALFFAGIKSHFAINEILFPLRNIVLGGKI